MRIGGAIDLVPRGRQEANPLLVKVGVALGISFAGFVAAQLRSRSRLRLPSTFASRSRPSLGTVSQIVGKSSVGLKEDLQILKGGLSSEKIVNGTSRTTTTTTTTTTTVVGFSPTSKSSGEDEGFILSEFNGLVMREFNSATSTPKKQEIKEESGTEQEIANLRNLVWYLQEKERSLELQLLEYYGMQEQEAAMRELENQLKISSVEAKLYSLRIESLLADKQRLEAQLTDHTRTVKELEAARATIKLLKKKLKSDGDQAKEKIASLHHRVSALQSEEQKEAQEEDKERKLMRLEELEEEAEKLKMINSRLSRENLELARKVESAQASASCGEGSEEANSLRDSNEKLIKDIEQLKLDRCADVEELVYLRWVNACLRYELRNYQPPPGKTVARDLSKSLSPRSEEKAKQLILEYGNSGGDDKFSVSMDLDSEYSSSSRASTAEPEETPIDVPSSARNADSKKKKFLSKLKKLVLGKTSNGNKAGDRIQRIPPTPSSVGSSGRRVSLSTSSIEDMIGRDSCGSFSSSLADQELTPANRSCGMDAQLGNGRCQNEDAWPQDYSTSVRRLRHGGKEDERESGGGGETIETEIKKFAVALKKTRGASAPSRRSASYSSSKTIQFFVPE